MKIEEDVIFQNVLISTPINLPLPNMVFAAQHLEKSHPPL